MAILFSRRMPWATTMIGRGIVRGKWTQSGQGGVGEERMIAQAIRLMRDKNYGVAIEVVNALQAQSNSDLFPVRDVLQNANLQVRLLTKADQLSGQALRYQMLVASGGFRRSETPVVALNLADIENLKQPTKAMKPLLHVLAGAHAVQHHLDAEKAKSMLVCGLPNVGKSSLIYALTKARTLEVRKKKGYHLPKVNSTAGWTLSTKTHSLPHPTLKNGPLISLADTPGLRPRMDGIDDTNASVVARLLAYGNMENTGGLFSSNPQLQDELAKVVWEGMKNHSILSGESFPYDTLPAFLEEQKRQLQTKNPKNVTDKMMSRHLMDQCRLKGNMVMELPVPYDRDISNRCNDIRIDQRSRIVAMNQTAKLLQEIGAGKTPLTEEILQQFQSRQPRNNIGQHQRQPNPHQHRRDAHATKPQEPASLQARPRPPNKSIAAPPSATEHIIEKNGADQPLLLNASSPEKSRPRRDFRKLDPKTVFVLPTRRPLRQGVRVQRQEYPKTDAQGNPIIICLPEKQWRVDCLMCAGFAKRSSLYAKECSLPKAKRRKKGLFEFLGPSFPRIIPWDLEDIQQFYSRVYDAIPYLPGGNLFGYLLHDSMVRTIARKQKLTSRRKAIKKYQFLVGSSARNWYVPNDQRHYRFQNHRPLPFPPMDCSAQSCRNQGACWKAKEAGEEGSEQLYLLSREMKEALKKKPLNKRSKSSSRAALRATRQYANKENSNEDS